MKLKALLPALWLCGSGVASLHAGQQVAEPKITVPEEKRTLFPDDPPGLVTVGTLFSEHRTGVYLDSVTGLYSPRERDAFLFLDSRYHYEDNSQFIKSTGLAFRKLFRDQKVILGVNAYYDGIHSENGNDFNQYGFGAEALTQWVDARINYYLPEDKQLPVGGSFTREQTNTALGAGGTVVQTTRTGRFRQYEMPIEGLNLEVGFLVPGVSKITEVRIFGGYHHYNNPYGSDFDGFQGRLEAHLLPGVIADLEYWDDTRLMGGHWTAGLRASVPFSFFNLAKLRNPFEGTSELYKCRPRDFDERLTDMVIRSHRIQTITSGPKLVHERDTETITPNGAPPPPPPLVFE